MHTPAPPKIMQSKVNSYKTVGDIKNLENKLHQSKRKALEFSTSKFSGTYSQEPSSVLASAL